MKACAIAFTEQGMSTGRHLAAHFPDISIERCPEGGLGKWTESAFQTADALVFIGAAGIAVRAIAPYIQKKVTDPAVIVMDEWGKYVIPILSGHIGGANELAIHIGLRTGAQPIITTATDINHIFAIDTWAKNQGLTIAQPECIKQVSSRLLAGNSIQIKSLYPICGVPPRGVTMADENSESFDVLISHMINENESVLHLIPPVITVGIGCRRGSSASAIETAFQLMLTHSRCHQAAVCGAATIDIKKDEPGILEFCAMHDFPLHTFSAHALAGVSGEFTSSPFVESITGIDNVCERAAVLSSGGVLLAGKFIHNGVTMALAIKTPQLKFKEETWAGCTL